MKNKQKFVLKVLHRYGVLVDFEGDPPMLNLRGPLEESETFKAWCGRVLDREAEDVTVFVPTRPASQKTIQRLAEETSMDFLSVIIREAQQSRDKQADEEMELIYAAHKEDLRKLRVKMKDASDKKVDPPRVHFPTVGADAIKDLLDGDMALEPSVREHLQRLSSKAEQTSADAMFKEVIVQYNDVVKQYRSLAGKPSDTDAW
jgi:hypothetical protein